MKPPPPPHGLQNVTIGGLGRDHFPLLCVRVHVTEAAVCGAVRYEK